MSKKNKKTEDISEEIEVDENFDDVVFESEEDQTSESLIKKLREKLKQALSEKQDYLEGWQRAKADSINAKKDFVEEKNKLVKFAKADLIIQLVPVLDSFEMALGNGKNEKVESQNEWQAGMGHIHSQLLSILKENGVEQLSPLNEKFNPVLQESIDIIEVDRKEKDGIIVEVLQKGYSLDGEIIRPAKVKVGEFKNEDIKT
jgi:molecular chaperone GrpE